MPVDDLALVVVDVFFMEVVLVLEEVAARDLSLLADELEAERCAPEGVIAPMFIS